MRVENKIVPKQMLLLLALSALGTVSAYAEDPVARYDQQEQARQLEKQRLNHLYESRPQIEDILSGSSGDESEKTSLEIKTKDEQNEKESSERESLGDITSSPEPRFTIHTIQIKGMVPKLDFLEKDVKKEEGKSYSLADINGIVDKENRKLIDQGYVTSRLILPSQNIGQGTLTLVLEPGYLGQVRYADTSAHIPWKNAFPIRPGELLNIRKLEQGLEQMKRVSSQDTKMELVPGTEPHTTDLVLTIQRTDKPIHGLVSLDNSGLKDTGSLQWNVSASADQFFRANDTFSFGFNGDGAQEGAEKGTRGHNLSYVIPSGNDTFSLQYYKYNYHQTVPSIPFIFLSSSSTKSGKVNWNHVFFRNKTVKRSWNVGIQRRTSHSFINDQEVDVQTMDTSDLILGLDERRYLGANTLYTSLSFKGGMGWFGAQEDYSHGNSDLPTTRYKQVILDMDYVVPKTWGHRPARIMTSFHGQWTLNGDRLYNRDMVSIGNRYTVQGFDGEHTLLGESGWYLRQEVSSKIGQLNSDIYAQVDMGAVYGPSTDILTGRFLAGGALGMRGQFNSGLFYDLFVSTPFYKPQGFKTAHVTTGFTAGWRF
ncbi:MAG: ShlB/FhaC/HecB family hemolysin secretion/activation protein [Veillonella sp.]|nr:ShlB/FhaC/HecB family hemolysin secretion/activation protein [Veillonella sp.]